MARPGLIETLKLRKCIRIYNNTVIWGPVTITLDPCLDVTWAYQDWRIGIKINPHTVMYYISRGARYCDLTIVRDGERFLFNWMFPPITLEKLDSELKSWHKAVIVKFEA